MKLIGKIIFSGKITTETGLHIGGSKSSLAIGGIDNNVIKSAKGQPYIPGSSLKGKLRSLLARAEGSLFFSTDSKEKEIKYVKEQMGKVNKNDKEVLERNLKIIDQPNNTDQDFTHIMELFGYSGDADIKDINSTRLLVRDAFLANEDDSIFLDGYTQSKWENVINRRTGTAEHPRQMERVPKGSAFEYEIVYNIFSDAVQHDLQKLNHHIKCIAMALKLLQNDGLGGQISRGYGKVSISNNKPRLKMITLADGRIDGYGDMELANDLNMDTTHLLNEISGQLPQA
ncbi:MAG: type III-A CRISPR-associated RAMP protein Csm3 [Bacteroidota bacterium]